MEPKVPENLQSKPLENSVLLPKTIVLPEKKNMEPENKKLIENKEEPKNEENIKKNMEKTPSVTDININQNTMINQTEQNKNVTHQNTNNLAQADPTPPSVQTVNPAPNLLSAPISQQPSTPQKDAPNKHLLAQTVFQPPTTIEQTLATYKEYCKLYYANIILTNQVFFNKYEMCS